MTDAFERAVRALASPDVPDGDLSQPFVDVLPWEACPSRCSAA